MKNIVCRLMFALLRYEYLNVKIDADLHLDINDDVLRVLYNVSRKHDLSHIVGKALDDNGLLDGKSDVSVRFMKSRILAMYHYEKQRYELNTMCDVLEANGVEHIPLKGSVLREYYNEPWMRTSGDIDLLIKKQNLDAAIELFVDKLNYTYLSTLKHDAQLVSTSNVNIELHYDLLEDGRLDNISGLLDDAWDNTVSADGFNYKKLFNNEFFYFYHIIHMAKHFEGGGCGIKPFLDMLIIEKNMEYDNDTFLALCNKYGMIKFYNAAKKLLSVWFYNDNHDELSKRMEDYILFGGVYGHSHSKNLVKKLKHGSKIKYLMTKVWKPYEGLKNMYPSLEGKRYLVPIYQLRRWGRLIFCGGAKQNIKNMGFDKDNTRRELEVAEMLKSVGLM